jgi:hypothetical protein
LGARGNEFVLGHYSRGRLLKDIERLYDDLAGSDGTVVFKEKGLAGDKAYSGHLDAKT